MTIRKDPSSELDQALNAVVADMPTLQSCAPRPPRTQATSAYALSMQEDPSRGFPIFAVLAILAHVALFAVVLPESPNRLRASSATKPRTIPIRTFTPPPPPPAARPVIERRLTQRLPVPDPTPREPEPLIERATAVDLSNQEFSFEPLGIGEPEPAPSVGPLIPDGRTVTNPELIGATKVQPSYPELARRAGLESRVTLQVIVLRDGSVGGIQVLQSDLASFGFDQAAIDAVRQWRYHPSRLDGRAVEVFITVVVTFSLN